jgi:Flp pilus assembly protein TadG
MFRLLSPRRRDEVGAVAILVAVMALLLCMFAAYAIDIGLQVNRKHQLNDTLDAAAQAGAFALPGSTVIAKTEALAFATAHDPTETGSLAPNVDFWCITASTGSVAPYAVDTTQIPATCNPGTSPYPVGENYNSTGRKTSCSKILCAIPCVEPVNNTASPRIACNTIRVFQGRDVPFTFANAGGIAKGSTGNVISVACKGSCGTVAPNPMDVVVVADRTGSMSSGDLSAMKLGINSMLSKLTPSQQYVAFGAIGRSSVASTPTSEPSGSCAGPSSSPSSGAWIPVPFSKNYLNGTTPDGNSALVKAVNCLNSSNQSSTGTSLAAPMKAASRYLLGISPNNLSSLVPARDAPITKVLIFETDGEPNEEGPTGGTASLSDPSDLFSNNKSYSVGAPVPSPPVSSGPTTPYPTKQRTTGTGSNKKTWTDTYRTTTVTTTRTSTASQNGGQNACANLNAVAANAKQAGILVITIAYNLGGNAYCGASNQKPALPAAVTTDSAPVVTLVEPSAAQTFVNGKPALKASYTGNATVHQRIDRTVDRTIWGAAAPDTLVRNTLAGAASPTASGVASDADNACSPGADQTAENSDGDYFFCAATGTDMASIFTTALSQVSKGIKLLKLP